MDDSSVFLPVPPKGGILLNGACDRLIVARYGFSSLKDRVYAKDPIETPEPMVLVQAQGSLIVEDFKTSNKRIDSAYGFLRSALQSGRIQAFIPHKSGMGYPVPKEYWATNEGLCSIHDGKFMLPEFGFTEESEEPSIDPQWRNKGVYVEGGDLVSLVCAFVEEAPDVKNFDYWTFAEAIIWIGTRNWMQLAVIRERFCDDGHQPSIVFTVAVLGMISSPKPYEQMRQELVAACASGSVPISAVPDGSNERQILCPVDIGDAEFFDDRGNIYVRSANSEKSRQWYSPMFGRSGLIQVFPADGGTESKDKLKAKISRGGRPPKESEAIKAAIIKQYPQGVPKGLSLKQLSAEIEKETGEFPKRRTLGRVLKVLNLPVKTEN